MKKTFIFILYLASFIIYPSATVFAVDVAPRISDREIIEKLAELKAGQLALQQRFNDVNKRIDDMKESTQQQINDLKESNNKRFDDVNKRFDTIQWMLGLFITVALSIMGIMGRILWNQQKKMTQIETSLETQKDELSFLKTLIEKLLPPKGVV